jgi:hypothetical protein
MSLPGCPQDGSEALSLKVTTSPQFVTIVLSAPLRVKLEFVNAHHAFFICQRGSDK